MTLSLWGSDRMKLVLAETPEEAARVYAERIARRYFGVKAYVRDVRPEPANPLLFRAFVCRISKGGLEAGRDVIIELEKRS